MTNSVARRPLFDPSLVRRALVESVVKLDPRHQLRNPVMFTVLVGSVTTTLLFVERLAVASGESPWFVAGVSLWLWFTVLFANFAEALAEGRSKAQAASLRSLKQTVMAKKLPSPHHGATWYPVKSEELRKGMHFLVEAGDRVTSGQVVAEIDKETLEASVREARAIVREAEVDRGQKQVDMRRTDDLYARGVESKEALDRLHAALLAALDGERVASPLRPATAG